MKVAYFSPLPPSTSGIADYSALLLPALEALLDVEVVRPGRTRPVADADVALYHIGNDPDAHGWILDALRRRPGVVVLHDFVIHHLVAGATIGRKDGHAYLSALEREAGPAGRMLGWGVLEGRVPPLWEVRPEEYPLAGEVLDRATGVIVHSHYVERRVREHGYDGPLWRIPHPAWPAPGIAPAAVEGQPLFGCFGHLNESKRIPHLLQAFAHVRRAHPRARLLLVGAESPGFDLDGRLARLGLDREGVVREPYVEEERLWALLGACDACVLLRAPTMGETSGSAIRTLSLGKPLVVNDVGWFAELPDDVAFKVPVGGEEEVAALAAALERLAEPGVAATMGAAARAYVAREHELGHVAELYAAALEQAAGAAAVEGAVLQAVAGAAADVNLAPEQLASDLLETGLVTGVPPAAPSRPGRWTQLARTWPMWFWVAALYVVAVVVHLSLGLRLVAPWIMVDELVYSDMARSFASTGHFLIRGAQAGYGPVYPLLLSPLYAIFGPVHDVYQWVRVVNALAMCSAVFPAYLLARRVVRAPAALLCATFAVAIPPLVYVGTVMTENAFYPIFLWLAYALVLALERPSPRRQVAVIALCGLAYLTRAQALALVLAVLSAPLVLAWIERGRPRRLAAWKPLYGIVAGAVVVLLVVELARGRSASGLLGGYSAAAGGGYRVWPVVEWVVLHAAALDLASFVVPAVALVVLLANARHLDERLRSFVAATTALTAWIVITVGVFASRFSYRLEERNLFYLVPLLVIALFAWIERGQPRPPRAAAAAALVLAALPGAIPFIRLLDINSESDTPFLQLWWFLGDSWVGVAAVGVVVTAVSIGLATAFVWLPRRWAPLLPAAVAVGLLLTWLPIELWTHSFPLLSVGSYQSGIAVAHADWIDRAVGRDAHVAVIWAGGNEYPRVWQDEFWNRSVDRVYDLGSPIPGGMPERPLSIQQSTGALLDDGKPLEARYVLTDRSVRLVGTPIAADTKQRLVLYRVTSPVRTSDRIVGWYGDTWTAPHAEWHRAACDGGTLRMLISSDRGLYKGLTQTVAITGTTKARTLLLPSTAQKPVELALTPVHHACVVKLDISPVRRPPGDPRLLGIHVAYFQYVPAK